MRQCAHMRALLVASIVFAVGCRPDQGPASPPSPEDTPAPSSATPPPPDDPAPSCAALPQWRYEHIALPPEFAPSLPRGAETLWFAPGMFKPDADDYFTYAFSLDWDHPFEPTAAALEPVLVDYYRGLMAAVAGGEPIREARVRVGEDGKTAVVVMSDEFTKTPEIEVSLRISGDAECLSVFATAKPSDATWSALGSADGCLCDAGTQG